MIINFSKDLHDRYIDKNAQNCVDATIRYLDGVLNEPMSITPTEECVEELQKVLPCRIKYRTKENLRKQYIFELEVDEKDYVVFLLKYLI